MRPGTLESPDRIETGTQKAKILDAAAGYGFPAREMRQRGWGIVLNEPSQAMRNLAHVHTASLGIFIGSVAELKYTSTLRWQEFQEHDKPEGYDAVVCLGNSLPYATGWGDESLDPERARIEIQKSLAGFCWILEREGTLVVTKHRDDSLVRGVKGRAVVDSTRIYEFETELIVTDETGVRHWRMKVEDKILQPGIVYQYDAQSYALRDDGLITMMEQVGFRNIQRRDIKGDNPGYTTFVARKA